MRLSTPRLITLVVSLLLVALALVSMRFPIPYVGRFVVSHRTAMIVAGYLVLLAGVVVQGL